MKKAFLLITLTALIIASCTPKQTEQPDHNQPAIKLELLGQVVIPHGHTFQNTTVGGLSGLAYDESSDQFYIISDDRSYISSARFYTVEVQLSKDDSLKKGGDRKSTRLNSSH